VQSIVEAAKGLVKARERFFSKQLTLHNDEIEQFHRKIKEVIHELNRDNWRGSRHPYFPIIGRNIYVSSTDIPRLSDST